ncbi:MAG: TetR/AcrR family transcriptional regulator [Mycobacteriaceae bacterium]|uniref:TetR/AcrR family transcriptional regulator n=1 Tax=Corynebacterium sp. TaxID=1720 RepID=UPI003F99895E
MPRSKNTPNDPQRRRRILDSTMVLLQQSGISAVTARGVAAQAGVPVGSVSYHFDSVKGLLLQASSELWDQRIAQITGWDYAKEGAEGVLRQLAELIRHQVTEGRSLTVVSYELYLLGLRDPDFRDISVHTVDALRQVLLDFFPAPRARHLAATADGYQLQLLLNDEAPSAGSILEVLRSA